jgi:hypothetical protein
MGRVLKHQRNPVSASYARMCARKGSGLMGQPNLQVCTGSYVVQRTPSCPFSKHTVPQYRIPPRSSGSSNRASTLLHHLYIGCQPPGIIPEDGNRNICRNTGKHYFRKSKSYNELNPWRPKDTSFMCVFCSYLSNIMPYKYIRVFATGV